jgi:hypothetical protein
VPFDESQPKNILGNGIQRGSYQMGKTEVRKRRSKGHTVEYRRGIEVDVLTWDGRAYKDKAGNEYVETEMFDGSHTVYHLKKAIMVSTHSYLGICDKVKTHRSWCDSLPRSKKCSCGGKFIYADITPEMTKVKRTKDNPYPGKGKKKGAI